MPLPLKSDKMFPPIIFSTTFKTKSPLFAKAPLCVSQLRSISISASDTNKILDLFVDFINCSVSLLFLKFWNDVFKSDFIHPDTICFWSLALISDKRSLGSPLGFPAIWASPKPDFMLEVIIGSNIILSLFDINEPAVVITIVLRFERELSF